MSDPTEQVRRQMVNEINSYELDRSALKDRYGYVWDTEEMQNAFEVISFLAPFVAVRDKVTGQKGTLTFQHMPRFYFDFQEV